jgi:DnaJ-domain-containing protein 1
MDDPFLTLDLPRAFALTPAQVAAAHMKVVALLHPDRAGSPLERDDFMRQSARAGQAKQQLMTDVGRAEALLHVLGVPAADAPLSAAFLAGTLEFRERIEEASQQGGAEGARALADIGQEVQAARAQVVAELGAALQTLTDESAKKLPVNMDLARMALARLRYVERMLTRLRET